jgi:hypothetical protein
VVELLIGTVSESPDFQAYLAFMASFSNVRYSYDSMNVTRDRNLAEITSLSAATKVTTGVALPVELAGEQGECFGVVTLEERVGERVFRASIRTVGSPRPHAGQVLGRSLSWLEGEDIDSRSASVVRILEVGPP